MTAKEKSLILSAFNLPWLNLIDLVAKLVPVNF